MEQMGLFQNTMEIMDKTLRNALISAAKGLEKMISDGSITKDTPIVSTTPVGLTVNVKWEQKAEGKPMIFLFAYSWNEEIYKRWLQSVEYLREGPLMFVARGLQVLIADDGKPEKVGVHYDDAHADDGRVWLELFDGKSVIFRVHRDVLSTGDWHVYKDE